VGGRGNIDQRHFGFSPLREKENAIRGRGGVRGKNPKKPQKERDGVPATEKALIKSPENPGNV